MPLRDHFRPPVEKKHSWDELHGMWPAEIVRQLFPISPEGYVAAPGVHLGASFEIDVSAYDPDGSKEHSGKKASGGNGGVATLAPPSPTLTLETDWPDQDEYEVCVYDTRHGRRLVAAVELISPGNKDRPESRRAFVAKVAALLQDDVCVSLVDPVTIRQFNLYGDLLELIGRPDLSADVQDTSLYAATLRGRKRLRARPLLDTWFYSMTVGQPLPALPIWLDVDLRVMLDLETSYEETCRLLHIA
jgi:Protein of unknown function (DUF4058)